MELAYQYLSQRVIENDPPPDGDDAEDVHDLVVLDTVTGLRRQLAADVAWQTPRWTTDGKRVRFSRRRSHGLVGSEVDVETGNIEEVEDDVIDGSMLPGFGDGACFSPAGRWIVYHHRNAVICVARADGSEAFALTLPFEYTAHRTRWSPCGAMIAAHLTTPDDTGTYVIDLRTGDLLRVSPDPDDQADGLVRFFLDGWSPDGMWVVVTKNRWPDPQSYDQEWNELWLLAADGTAARQLTEDGRCRHAAIRPTCRPPIANAEHELTFEWARPLRGPADPPPAGDALAARIRINLEPGPPLAVILMVRTREGMLYPIITGCRNIPDAFERLDVYLADNGYRPSDDLTVVFPRYTIDEPDLDRAVLAVEDIILAETNTRLWRFAHRLPRTFIRDSHPGVADRRIVRGVPEPSQRLRVEGRRMARDGTPIRCAGRW